MRQILIICSIVAAAANAILLIVLSKLRKYLDDRAWLLILLGFLLVFINNIIIAYLVLERPGGKLAVYLIITFFIIKATKNVMWPIGFILVWRDFRLAENLPEYMLKQLEKKHENNSD